MHTPKYCWCASNRIVCVKMSKLQISASALVELKATLFSKQREVRNKAKKGALTTNTVSEKTSAIWRKPPKQNKRGGRVVGSEAAKERIAQRSAEEEAELERSRKALEAKAALYDRLCGGEGLKMGGSDSEGEDGEGRYMVDFTRKIAEERRVQRSNAESKSNDVIENINEGVAEEVGEWVEYVDSFGRTRRCAKEDLPHMKFKEEEERRRERSVTPDLLSEDMAMERERRRWEAEQEKELDEPVGPVHYEAMRQGEVRTHGVGYYALSKDEEKRSEQLNLLNKLRDQTTHQREKKMKLQEKRKALMAARLAKVRERKQLKQMTTDVEEGKDTEVDDLAEEREGAGGGEEGGNIDDPIAAMIESELGRAREKAEKEGAGEKEEETTRKKKPYVRPWDKGKVVDPIRKRKKELEDERLTEFAPPSSFDKIGTTTRPKLAKLDQTDQKSDQSEPLVHGDGTTMSSADEATRTQWQQNLTSSSGSGFTPPPPPPNPYQTMPQPAYYIAPFPYPPNMVFSSGLPPPPPQGPPPNWYPYFHPPPHPTVIPPSEPQS